MQNTYILKQTQNRNQQIDLVQIPQLQLKLKIEVAHIQNGLLLA